MFPTNSCCNGHIDPISFSEQAFFHKTFLTDISIPNSKQDPVPLCPPPLFYFPSSFEEENPFLIHDLLLHSQQPLLIKESDKPVAETNYNSTKVLDSDLMKNPIKYEENNISSTGDQNKQQIPRKRSCKKRDRHSKVITTGKRPRHRRMRLSLEVARQFFDLQDMLGFERASKTVEWLLVQAKSEITKLKRELNYGISLCAGASSTSEGEVVSSLDEVAVNGDQGGSSGRAKTVGKEKKACRQSRRSTFNPQARESREKARERARERTKEKLRSRGRLLHDEMMTKNYNNELSRLSSWSGFETGEESRTQSQNLNNNSPMQALAHEFEELKSWSTAQENQDHHPLRCTNNQAMVVDDQSLFNVGKWSPSSIFSSLQNNNTVGSGISQDQHLFADLQFYGKPWTSTTTTTTIYAAANSDFLMS
ncbi:hypothetical protein UlMin_008496 [Ulmus minor]